MTKRWRRGVVGLVLIWLIVCAIGAWITPRPSLAELPDRPEDSEARLLCAPLPSVLAYLAVHCWFIVRDRGRWQRWEVWQEIEGSPWGHVHRNLQGPLDEVGGGPPLEYARLQGEEAAAFTRCLQETSPHYPDRDTYRAWPGPNSNSYVDALLRACDWRIALPSLAIGKDWRGLIGASGTTQGTGFQLETPLVGARVGLQEGIEVHVLTLSLGIDLWPPAIQLPFGRFGFADR